MLMNEGSNVVKDALRLDSTPAAAAAAAAAAGAAAVSLRPTLDGVVNGPTSYPAAVDSAVLASPNSRQQLSEQSRNRRPLIGQGNMNANDMPAPAAANYGAVPQNVVPHAPMGRPIVKGNLIPEFSK